MEEFFLIILLGMIVYIPIGILVAFLVWLHDLGVFKGGFTPAMTRILPLYLQSPDHRIAAVIVLAILLGISPLVMVDHFLAGIILFVSSMLILAVIRGLVPLSDEISATRSLL
jgi:hypothetical protein